MRTHLKRSQYDISGGYIPTWDLNPSLDDKDRSHWSSGFELLEHFRPQFDMVSLRIGSTPALHLQSDTIVTSIRALYLHILPLFTGKYTTTKCGPHSASTD